MFFSTSSLGKIFANQNYLLMILESSSHGVLHAVEFTPSSSSHMLPLSAFLLIVLDLDFVHCFASHSLHSPHFPHWQSAKYNYTICCNWKLKLFLLNKKQLTHTVWVISVIIIFNITFMTEDSCKLPSATGINITFTCFFVAVVRLS